MQFFLRLNRCNSFSRYRASLADSYTDRRKKEEESQKIDDLPILATHRSGTTAMFSSKVNSCAWKYSHCKNNGMKFIPKEV